jgi:UDP-N-acetylmuramyl pentapeptide phosphotransferase/UDP-N-acetylglucosamine-1-phosphate transferase
LLTSLPPQTSSTPSSGTYNTPHHVTIAHIVLHCRSVLQYSFLRPLISITEIICQAFGVLCPTTYSIYFAEVYLDAIDFVSISVALYGLIAFYDLVKEQLAGKKPLSKFLCIKMVVMLTFCESTLSRRRLQQLTLPTNRPKFHFLHPRIARRDQGYRGTSAFLSFTSHAVANTAVPQYWTATNVADGLNALCICCEMVIMSVAFAWAFNWNEYKRQAPPGAPHTNVFWAILDSLNYC